MGLLKRLKRKREPRGPRCAAVVPAAGSSRRMEGQDKILLPLDDIPVLVHTLQALSASEYIQEIVVVTREDLIVPVGQLCRDCALDKVTKVLIGGATRADSVLAGVEEVSGRAELIAVHDGARPLVTVEVIDEAIRKGRGVRRCRSGGSGKGYRQAGCGRRGGGDARPGAALCHPDPPGV